MVLYNLYVLPVKMLEHDMYWLINMIKLRRTQNVMDFVEKRVCFCSVEFMRMNGNQVIQPIKVGIIVRIILSNISFLMLSR